MNLQSSERILKVDHYWLCQASGWYLTGQYRVMETGLIFMPCVAASCCRRAALCSRMLFWPQGFCKRVSHFSASARGSYGSRFREGMMDWETTGENSAEKRGKMTRNEEKTVWGASIERTDKYKNTKALTLTEEPITVASTVRFCLWAVRKLLLIGIDCRPACKHMLIWSDASS